MSKPDDNEPFVSDVEREGWGFIVDARSSQSDIAFWWKPGGSGYTSDLNKAGLYTRTQYEKHLGKDNVDHVFVDLSVALHAARQTVLFEDLGVPTAEVAKWRRRRQSVEAEE